MNENDLSSKNTSSRRVYHRRNRKGNRTSISPSLYLTTTSLLPASNTLIDKPSAVPVNDLFVPISYFTQHKEIFLGVLTVLMLLCVISMVFLIVLKCLGGKSCKARRQERRDKKRLKDIPDFLDDQNNHKDENDILLEPNDRTNSLRNTAITTNGILPNDNISNTFSLDPMLEQKIIRNNPPNAIALSPMADDTSLDTLRGSLISSPSQKISAIQSPPTPTQLTPITTTDSIGYPDERVLEAEKDDDFNDLDLKRIQPRYTKAVNNSSNLPAHRTSGSSIEQSIRKQERRAEEEERGLLHGSNSNLYEKEMRKQAEQEVFARKQHTHSQVSLVSRTSEDSCY